MEDTINYENKIDEDSEPDKVEVKPLADYNTHNVSSTVYNIHRRPKDDDSDEWEEIPMEEEVIITKQKGGIRNGSDNKPKDKEKEKIIYIDDEDDAKNIPTSTKGMIIDESDDDESDDEESNDSNRGIVRRGDVNSGVVKRGGGSKRNDNYGKNRNKRNNAKRADESESESDSADSSEDDYFKKRKQRREEAKTKKKTKTKSKSRNMDDDDW